MTRKKKSMDPFLHELFAFKKPYEVRVIVMFLHHTGSSLAAATVKSVQLLSVSRLIYLENLAAAPKLNGKNGVQNTK